jgi:hypothetical protein
MASVAVRSLEQKVETMNVLKKSLIGLVSAAALTVGVAGVASAKGATQDNDPAGKNFMFWNGNGVMVNYQPSSYHDVLAPDGSETEVFKGVIANDTGDAVVYTAGVGPVPADQTAWSFATNRTTPDWQLTISASGNYTLTAHFAS